MIKLLNKTSKFYIIATIIVFLIGGIVFYVSLNSFIDDDITEKLYEQKSQIQKQIEALDSVQNSVITSGGGISIKKIPIEYSNKIEVKDTLLYDEDKEEVPSRMIQFYAKSKHFVYSVILIKSLVESDELVKAIGLSLLVLVILFIAVSYFLNRKISKLIWNPFYKTLSKIKTFDINSTDKLELVTSDILEFNELNLAISQLTDKVQADYKNLKEFTENASHEIQTPLAIIKNKMELLIQSVSLKEEEMKIIQATYEATSRLSKLNQALILLTKIENQQFSNQEILNFSEELKKHIDNFSELIQAKEIELNVKIQNDVKLRINKILIDVLISNLISNAIKHNVEKGKISIELESTKFTISNTGNVPTINPNNFFERFKKDKTTSDSLGLGLAIVKQICEHQGLSVDYSYQNNLHTLTIKFR